MFASCTIKNTSRIIVMVFLTAALVFSIGGCSVIEGNLEQFIEDESTTISSPGDDIVEADEKDEKDDEGEKGEDEPDPIRSTEQQADTVFSIIGDGVETPMYFSLQDLKRFADSGDRDSGYLEQIFSMVNNWPTEKLVVAKGADINVLLDMAGLKQEAGLFHIETADNYYAIVTREQLLGKRFYFPYIMEGRSRGAIRVEPMIAWAWEIETGDISKAKDADLRLFIGQLGLQDANAVPSVQNVISIKALIKPVEKWSPPSVLVQDGTVTFSHEAMDQVKLHYTIDGVRPNHNSPVYNPSTTYLQPERILPIEVKGKGKVKVLAIGYGKDNSDIVEYDYYLTE